MSFLCGFLVAILTVSLFCEAGKTAGRNGWFARWIREKYVLWFHDPMDQPTAIPTTNPETSEVNLSTPSRVETLESALRVLRETMGVSEKAEAEDVKKRREATIKELESLIAIAKSADDESDYVYVEQ